MIILIAGLVLLAAPFLLMDLFFDKKRGFIYVLFFSLLFQTILAISIQACGLFYYSVAAGCTLFVDIILLLAYLKIKIKSKKHFSFNLKNIDWVIIIIVAISLLSFYQVHYDYTGKMSLVSDAASSYHEVKNMAYSYPYFSDEWYAVSLIGGAISNHFLPVKDILNNSFFPNLELPFHSFMAQIMLILGLSPLLQYTALSIFLNTLIVLLVYLFLRINSIPRLTAGICSLFTIYITSGSNLPGLWQFVPFNLGIILFLLVLCFSEICDAKMVFLSVILASLFYPPLIPFYFIGLSVFLLGWIKIPKEKLLKKVLWTLLFLFFAVPIFYMLLMVSPLAGATSYILSKIFFVSFVAPFVSQMYFYNIIPIPAILLAVLGIYYISKNKKWILLSELILGVVFWFFYTFTYYRFFIEYERIAIITSVITVIVSGFGLWQLEKYVKFKFVKTGGNIFKILELVVLLIFLILIPFYTQGERWRSILAVYPATGAVAYPRSPANNYLTADDLKIFKNIKNKTFLSLPWKGTVIGVATGNHPILTKQGTISLGNQNVLNNFVKRNCVGKENMVKKLELDYIYIYKFDCPGFKELSESSEGLVLYKVDKK